ncbi:glycoside hydrolase family 28 protein [candidate division KSB1 bacterium]|nr:glycoside hydrolase family 28 protein [candidate division KSB1 bacterium]
MKRFCLFFLFICCLYSFAIAQHYFNIQEYGAVGDGLTLNTTAIQKAIDDCATNGGTVYVPPGRFLSGTLFLKSGVALYFDHGAVLLGSTHQDDYPVTIPARRSYTDNYVVRSLIYAEKAQRLSIYGTGTIDGQGEAFKDRRSYDDPYKRRPYLIRMIDCRDISIKDITLVNSPMWVQHYLACDNLHIDGISVRSHVAGNNDGIDIDACRHVRIANCHIESGDDAIVLKSTTNRACEDVVVTNCLLSSHCNAFKLGTESSGGFVNILFSNSTIYDTRLAAIALETVDGGRLERVNVNNIVINKAGTAIFVRLGNRARPFLADTTADQPGIGSLRNVNISHIIADSIGPIGCSITGIPAQSVRDIRLSDIFINYIGGGSLPPAETVVPEHEASYPEFHMFGVLPAYGFYIRHVDTVSIHNMHLSYAEPDERPALYFEDVQNITLFDFFAQLESAAPALVRMKNVNSGLVHGCRIRGISTFLFAQATSDLILMNNDFKVGYIMNQDQSNSNIIIKHN